jgi:hypothetical protein
MKTSKSASLVDAQDILDHAIRLAGLIAMAAESLRDGHSEISMGTNAIIDKIEEAKALIVEFGKDAA